MKRTGANSSFDSAAKRLVLQSSLLYAALSFCLILTSINFAAAGVAGLNEGGGALNMNEGTPCYKGEAPGRKQPKLGQKDGQGAGGNFTPGVVINEIHYHPQVEEAREFIELYNTGEEPVDLAGWSFTAGIEYTFPPETVIQAEGFLVVCSNPEALSLHFDLPQASIRLWGDSALENDGELVTVTDSNGAVVDEVWYDNRLPWPAGPDGNGPSLQRICPYGYSRSPANWAGESGQAPTPLAPNHLTRCPPEELPSPEIVLNEIHYHPRYDRDEELEFVEIFNRKETFANLTGCWLVDGIHFSFPPGTFIEPKGFLVVCRNQEKFTEEFGVTNTIGDFRGRLSNNGERITLVDENGKLLDSVRYSDHGKWPVSADSLGYSLEKIKPEAASDDPGSWAGSGYFPGEGTWQTVSVTGPATSDLLYIYVKGRAEFLIDDLSLVNTENPEKNLLPNPQFDSGLQPWEGRGNHSESFWDEKASALHLISTGRGTGFSNSVGVETTQELDRSSGTEYRLTFSYLHLSGSRSLVCRLSISTQSRGIYFELGNTSRDTVTPGERNNAASQIVPPFISNIDRFPRQPTSDDSTTITAHVRGQVTEIKLTARLEEGTQTFAMLKKEPSAAVPTGDSLYSVSLPPQPHNTAVTFSIEAFSGPARRRFPSKRDPMEYLGYYVTDYQPQSPLPVYTLVVPRHPRSFTSSLSCNNYTKCSFAYQGDLYYNVSIRARGQSVCPAYKQFMKLKFHRGHYFKGCRKLNLQSLWTDKSLIRERMAWDLFDEMGNPYCFHYYVRLHANGAYFGLYAAMEHPDERFLERNGLDSGGNLYKAVHSREERRTNYRSYYEKETNEAQGREDFSDLAQFLDTMHTTFSRDLLDFFRENVVADAVIDYQASQILCNNRDYPHKNHFLFHDLQTGKWLPITWDMDLTYGKRWNGNYSGVYNDKMDNPGINPWYTTAVHGGGIGNHFLDKFFRQCGAWYRRAYIVRLWDAINEKYTLDFYEKKIAAFRKLLWKEQLEDYEKWGRTRATRNDPTAPSEFDPNLDRVRQHIKSHRRYIINYLRTYDHFSGHDRLKITELMYNPPGDERGEFIELWNNSGEPIDISGWSIESRNKPEPESGKQPFKFFFPENSTVAEDEVIILAKDPRFFRDTYGDTATVFGPYPGNLNNAGDTLRLKDSGPGYPATIDRLEFSDHPPWPLRPDGVGYTLELKGVHADIDNDLPGNWRASAQRGGSPGLIQRREGPPTYFTRGNCNGDKRIDLSDVVTILRHLFGEGMEPPCLAGCNLNGDQAHAIDDAVLLVRYLYGAEQAEIPYPRPGSCAPAPEGACAQSNCLHK